MSIAEKLQTIAENEQRVFDAGKNTEWSEFWDNYQHKKGQPQRYRQAFSGVLWNERSFKPKYNIVPTDATQMFMNFGQDTQNGQMDLSARAGELGITVDFSQCSTFSACFSYARINKVGKIDCKSASDMGSMFQQSSIETIDNVISHSNLKFTNTFQYASFLTHITFEGDIGNSISFADCSSLTPKSVQSIIDALMTITDGVARTLTLHADVRAKLTSEQVNTIKNVKGWSLIPE